MKKLNEEFKIKPDEIEDEHLLQMKNEIKETNNKMDRLSLRIKDLLPLTQALDLEQEKAIRKLTADYQHVITQKMNIVHLSKKNAAEENYQKKNHLKHQI